MWLVGICVPVLAEEPVIRNLPIAWFEAPEHHAPHWHVDFEHPTLTYSQRFALSVKATIPVDKDSHPDWHILLRIADSNGKWFESYGYFRMDLRPMPSGAQPVSWHGRVFVHPGVYRLALLAYNSVNQQHFVWHKTVTVKRPADLPDLDRDLPNVEFEHRNWNAPPIPEYLPVPTPSPLRVDVVFNVTPNLQLGLGNDHLDAVRTPVEESVRGAAAVLTQLAVSDGCLRVSAIDVLRLRVAADRSSDGPVSALEQVQRAIAGRRDNAAINVATLAGRVKAREFFHQFINGIATDDTGCGPQLPSPRRVIIVVSDSLVFPSGEDTEPLAPVQTTSLRFFHIRFSAISYKHVDSVGTVTLDTRETTFDEVARMLSQFRPRTFDVAEPLDLRHAVAQIVDDIGTAAPAAATVNRAKFTP